MKFLIVLLCIILILAVYSVTEIFRFKITRYSVEQINIPASLDGKTIMLLSDMHCTRFGRNNSRLFKAIEECEADYIVIAGDLINGIKKSESAYADEFLNFLSTLKKPIFYEFGNHEIKLRHKAGRKAYRRYVKLSSLHAKVLNNSYFELTEGVRLYGLLLDYGYYYGSISKAAGQIDLQNLLRKPDSDSYNILLAHDPSFWKEYKQWGADLCLSGHLHGGIIRLPFLGGLVSPRYRFFPKHDKGFYRAGDFVHIVSGGLGWHEIPFRFNNLPEIVCIHFVKTESFRSI